MIGIPIQHDIELVIIGEYIGTGTSSPHKALVAPTLFCEVTLKVYLNPASRLGTVILVVSTLLIETGTGLLIMNSSSNV